MFSCFTESCRLDEGLHSPRFYSLALKESCARPPARVSSLVLNVSAERLDMARVSRDGPRY